MTTQTSLLNTEQTDPGSETPTQGTANSVCAIVVAFFPDHEFEERLLTVLPQVESLVVVDNTPGSGCARRLKPLTDRESHLHVIENQTNLGVAAALNQGLSLALNQGSQWLLTLDQDTVCYPDIVETLLHTRANCELAPAVIGGNYLDPRNGKNKVAEDRTGTWLEQKTVITSGCLVDVAIAHHIGGFRDNFFIDQVDHEFCLRMRAQGRRVIISRKPVMMHSVGEPDGPRLPFLGALPSHPPLRKYYITRNSLVTVADYWQQEPEWCLRRSVRLLLGLALMALLEKNRLPKVRAFAAGVVDGLHRRMGPCGHAWLNRTD